MNARRNVIFGSVQGAGSGTSLVRLVVAAALVAMALTALAGSVSPVAAERISKKGNSAAIPPEGCPPGWVKATPPLNPALGCVPATETAAGGGEYIPPAECPPGFEQATYPLNPQLGCLPVNITDGEGSEPVKIVGTTIECPEGTVQAVPPLNPALGCVPATFTAEVQGELRHPNRCPDGWKPAESPLNPDLRCVPDTIVAKW